MGSASQVARFVQNQRLALTNEKSAQAALAERLEDVGYPAEREVKLSKGNYADVLVGDGVLIEVKLRSTGKREIYRQLERYAKHETVKALVLVTNVAMGLPKTIQGKPAYLVNMGRAWL